VEALKKDETKCNRPSKKKCTRVPKNRNKKETQTKMKFVTKVKAFFGKRKPPLALSSVEARKYTTIPERLPDPATDPFSPRNGYRPPASVRSALADATAQGPPPLPPNGIPEPYDVTQARLIDQVSKRLEALEAGQNALAKDPNVTTPESLDNAKTGWAYTFKQALINNFIAVAIGASVATYFLVTAKHRQDCIREVFALYPQFRDADSIEALMKSYNNLPCGTTDSTRDKQCAAVQRAYQMLKECDNTLFKNIVAAGLNAASDATDWGREELGKTLEKLGEVFSGVLPIVLGVVGAIILACIALWFFTRERGAHGPGYRPIENLRGRLRRFRGSAEQAFGRHMRARAIC
jgi:hypothetical protein